MLKRCQILIEDWQLDFLQVIIDEFDISLSEAVRMCMSYGFLCGISVLHPETKYGLDVKTIRKVAVGNLPKDVMHKLLSKVYFEARKAVDYRMSKLKK